MYDPSTKYIFGKLDEICMPAYASIEEDILKFRLPTTQITRRLTMTQMIRLRFVSSTSEVSGRSGSNGIRCLSVQL